MATYVAQAKQMAAMLKDRYEQRSGDYFGSGFSVLKEQELDGILIGMDGPATEATLNKEMQTLESDMQALRQELPEPNRQHFDRWKQLFDEFFENLRAHRTEEITYVDGKQWDMVNNLEFYLREEKEHGIINLSPGQITRWSSFAIRRRTLMELESAMECGEAIRQRTSDLPASFSGYGNKFILRIKTGRSLEDPQTVTQFLNEALQHYQVRPDKQDEAGGDFHFFYNKGNGDLCLVCAADETTQSVQFDFEAFAEDVARIGKMLKQGQWEEQKEGDEIQYTFTADLRRMDESTPLRILSKISPRYPIVFKDLESWDGRQLQSATVSGPEIEGVLEKKLGIARLEKPRGNGKA